MKLLNSSTNQLVDLNDQKITIYNCGPTVYNYVHIGNVRPLVVFDVLHRFLLNQRKEVVYIQNITDVDDKIIKAAAAEGISEKELTTRYTNAYQDIFQLLNIRPVIMPHVSEHIEAIKEYISNLIKIGAAYVVDGDVYFDISKVPNYGHVSHQDPNKLLEGVRKENKTNKKNHLDFVLWKQTTEGISWESPWSQGRPGWHTECCVLINKYAGDHVTIHGGGVDLKFPHHENENAQNFALYGRDIADIWMHVGHINVEGAKMSKSLNNFILVKDLVNANNANGLRWFFYKAKYEQPVNFSKQLLDEATKEVNSVVRAIAVARTYNIANDVFFKEAAQVADEFASALSDDLNLPNAITYLLSQVSKLNTIIREKKYIEANSLCCVIAKELDVLGIKYELQDHAASVKLIKDWKKAVDEKNYEQADQLRKQLVEKGLL
ncbi:MAG: cysteine--tRNA ligase [Mycoplasma sp.]|nr:cysteine--tRNA ligase [Candidatus Hennigella equi]